MPSVSINMHNSDGEPNCYVLPSSDGPFIVVNFSHNLSMYLPGFGADSSSAARALATELLRVADEVDVKASEPVAVEGEAGR